MLLTSFMYATGMLCTMLANTFSALDVLTLIDSPHVSFLDFMLTAVILSRAYSFILFLSGQSPAQQEPPALPEDMYG